ncbi:acyltransferase family protein [Lelliottia aquatilis]|uniref:acyltransferase family protein n=1 Tax=Lelliottia aquatilis TaxID=2080838 RepID=UPI00192B0EE3|nr:acyltransferase [Lelliottia aquatilis]
MTVTSVKNKTNYRADIDGLRAIAVISVILYHFDVSGFNGGFVGVDIFFVISGYLITKGIVSAFTKDKFSFSDFYLRRTRRLIPALLVVIFLTFIFSFYLLGPADFASFSGSVVYSLAGISNFYFWMQSGYFDSFSNIKPLLHTWSLSVELQFYLLWPIIVIGIVKYLKGVYRFISVLIFIICFSCVSFYYLNVDSSGAFYLPWFRMHEFVIGAIVVFCDGVRIRRHMSSFLYILGLALVLIPIFFYDIRNISFPGYFALIPCVGAALLIFSGEGSIFRIFTANKVASHIGEISYSLYLVHWPLYVLWSYVLVAKPSIMWIVLMCCATLIASYLLYYCVERKFRFQTNKSLSGPAFTMVCMAFIVFLTLPAATSWANKGWEWRLPKEVQNINNLSSEVAKDYTWQLQSALVKRDSFDSSHSKQRVLVIGDSQSADVINMMNESGVINKFDVIARTVDYQCATPYVNEKESGEFFNKINKRTIADPGRIPKCLKQIAAATDPKLLATADRIYVAMFYENNLDSYVQKGIEFIKDNSKAEIYVFGRKNLSKSSIDIVNAFGRLYGVDKYAHGFVDKDALIINANLGNIKGVKFIDLLSFICPDEFTCRVLTRDNKPIFYDYVHLTKYGAKSIGNALFVNLKDI